MTATKTFGAIGLLVTLFASTSLADTYGHIDEVACRIERQTRQIVQETKHYRHTPEYRYLLEDARELCRLADHIHDIADAHGGLALLEADLRDLCLAFEHLESMFDRIERRAALGQRYIQGNTAHVKRLLCSIEEDIVLLKTDLRTLRTSLYRSPRVTTRRPYVPPTDRWDSCSPRPVYGGSVGYGRPAYGHATPFGHPNAFGHPSPRGYSRGITIGGGSSRFTIRF